MMKTMKTHGRVNRAGAFALALTLLVAGGWSQASQAGEVTLTKSATGVTVQIDGQPFTALSTSKDFAKPFFHPVHAADGAVVTRVIENPEDHPHHKGIWFTLDEVSGLNFWAEKARVETQSVEIVQPSGDVATIRYVSHWLKDDGQPLLEETTETKIYPNRLMTFDFTLKAVSTPVHFEDTKEGMFGIRLPNGMREKETGKVVNAEGLKGTKECWGKESAWVDYSGEVGSKVYGVTLLDHPANFRKSRYHVRDYGLFSVSPFGPHAYTNGTEPEAPVTIEAGQTVRLRYGLFVHSGDAEAGHVAEAAAKYLDLTK